MRFTCGKCDLRQDPLVKVTEKLGCDDFYKKSVLNDLSKSPDVQIDGNTLMIHELYDNSSISDDLKALGHETLDTARYIASTTYTAAKAIITDPKVLGIALLGIAIGGSGC